MKVSLLDKARSKETKPNLETAELSVEWATGGLTFTQVQQALGCAVGSGVYAVLARGLRDALKLGVLERKA